MIRIVVLSELCYLAVHGVIYRYVESGAASIKPAERRHRAGDGSHLNAAQEQKIQRIICGKRPKRLKMELTLWSRAAAMQLIERECVIRLSMRGVGNYFTRWGLTTQKSIKKAYWQRPEMVQAWLDEQYPGIEARAKAESAEIQWGDETTLVNTDVRGSSYAPPGKTPVAFAVGSTRQKLSMLATVTNQGKRRRVIIDDAFNSDRLIEFLDALIPDAKRKVFLILHDLRVHHSNPVKAWVAERSERIELFYLPSYRPQINPEERLNADLKHVIGSKVPARTKAKLKNVATNTRRRSSKHPSASRNISRIHA